METIMMASLQKALHFLLINAFKSVRTTLPVILSMSLAFVVIFSSYKYILSRDSFELPDENDNHLTVTNSIDFTSIPVCVLVRVNRWHISYLPVLALAVFHAGIENITMYAVNIDKHVDNRELFRIIGVINKVVNKASYISYLEVGSPIENDYGFTLTDRALTFLYDRHEQYPSMCEYVILTNGDNLYSRNLGRGILPHMHAKRDVIAWDFVSRNVHSLPIRTNKIRKSENPKIFDDGTAKCHSVTLQVAEIDLGAAAYRLQFLQKHRLHLRYANGSYSSESDGYFAQTAASLTKSS
ncbi:unnamed protein product, partial [Rotaria magnacalcarata]